MRLSNSMLRAFFGCPRAYYYRYQMNLVPIIEKESAAKLGILFHRAVELDDTTLLDENTASIYEIYKPFLSALTFKAKELVLCAKFGKVQIQGILDGIIENEDGSLSLYELKTTSSKSSIEKINEVRHNRQIQLYALIAKKNKMTLRDIVLDVVSLKQLPMPPRLLKSGKLSMDKSQRTTTKLYREFVETSGYMPTEEEDMFFEMYFPEDYNPITREIIPIKYNEKDLIAPFKWLARQKEYHKNEASCFNYGKCDYYELCTANPCHESQIISSNFKVLENYRN